MSRPSRDAVLMAVASTLAQRATCSLASVGVVVARDGRVLTTGYNGAPSGMEHCEHNLGFHESPRCEVAVHSEANAIAFAARYGVSLQGAELFTTMSPCLTCAKLIINAGIVRVVTGAKYLDDLGVELLEMADVQVDSQYPVESEHSQVDQWLPQ